MRVLTFAYCGPQTEKNSTIVLTLKMNFFGRSCLGINGRCPRKRFTSDQVLLMHIAHPIGVVRVYAMVNFGYGVSIHQTVAITGLLPRILVISCFFYFVLYILFVPHFSW